MASRIYNAVLKWKESNRATGGKGLTSPSKFIRLPEDVLSEVDDLIDEYYLKYGEYFDSPRSARLFEFLVRLIDILDPK